MTDSVIPPVEAGTINSSIEIEYSASRGDASRGSASQNSEPIPNVIEATNDYAWQFDSSAYFEHTGLDIGGEYPYVAQENGHTIRVVTDLRVDYYESSSNDPYTVAVEQKAVRGTTHWEYFWTRNGFYDLNEELEVTNTYQERQPYRQRNSDIPHYELPNLDRVEFESTEDIVYSILHGRYGSSMKELLQEAIEMDSPDEAIPASQYNFTTESSEKSHVTSD